MTVKRIGAFARGLLVALTGSAACSDGRLDHLTAPRAPALGVHAGTSAERIQFDGIAFDCESIEGEITLNGNMLHIRGRLNTGPFLSDNDMVSGESTVLVDINVNLTNFAGSFGGTLTLRPTAHPDATWEGQFAGHIKGGRLDSDPLTVVDSHIVVQGQGAYHGMTLAFDHFINPGFLNPFDTPHGCEFVGERWTGVIVIPKGSA
jgi:hypothetical protein